MKYKHERQTYSDHNTTPKTKKHLDKNIRFSIGFFCIHNSCVRAIEYARFLMDITLIFDRDFGGSPLIKLGSFDLKNITQLEYL